MLRPNQSLKVIVAGASGSCSGHYNFHRWAGAPLCYLDRGSTHQSGWANVATTTVNPIKWQLQKSETHRYILRISFGTCAPPRREPKKLTFGFLSSA